MNAADVSLFDEALFASMGVVYEGEFAVSFGGSSMTVKEQVAALHAEASQLTAAVAAHENAVAALVAALNATPTLSDAVDLINRIAADNAHTA